jgi:murein DD-endopeptidase MepM/ murein hydrolase activator NlpD
LEPKKSFISKLTNKYLLIIRNEDNFAEKSTLSFSYAKLIFFIVFTFAVIFSISLYLSTTILARWFDPRHAEIEVNKKLFELTLEIDSLEQEVYRKHQFITNLKAIVSGEDGTEPQIPNNEQEQTDNQDLVKQVNLSDEELANIDEEFRKEFEANGGDPAPLSNSQPGDLQEMFLFKPVVGIITDHYNVKDKHYGVDIVAKQNEPVKCVTDGTVILSSWTQDSGYIIAVQHRSNLISVYKHNAELLKNVGDFVKAGEVISIIGNTGELTTGPHLHLELWYNGNPVNPEEYVAF